MIPGILCLGVCDDPNIGMVGRVFSLCAQRQRGCHSRVNLGIRQGLLRRGADGRGGRDVALAPVCSFLAYTDAKGYFTLGGLAPGSYDVRVSAPSFLPTLREDVALAAGATKVLNITLNTLFDAARMLPPRKRDNDEDDSWRWTLRSTANRPILRFDDGTPVVVEAFPGGPWR